MGFESASKAIKQLLIKVRAKILEKTGTEVPLDYLYKEYVIDSKLTQSLLRQDNAYIRQMAKRFKMGLKPLGKNEEVIAYLDEDTQRRILKMNEKYMLSGPGYGMYGKKEAEIEGSWAGDPRSMRHLGGDREARQKSSYWGRVEAMGHANFVVTKPDGGTRFRDWAPISEDVEKWHFMLNHFFNGNRDKFDDVRKNIRSRIGKNPTIEQMSEWIVRVSVNKENPNVVFGERLKGSWGSPLENVLGKRTDHRKSGLARHKIVEGDEASEQLARDKANRNIELERSSSIFNRPKVDKKNILSGEELKNKLERDYAIISTQHSRALLGKDAKEADDLQSYLNYLKARIETINPTPKERAIVAGRSEDVFTPKTNLYTWAKSAYKKFARAKARDQELAEKAAKHTPANTVAIPPIKINEKKSYSPQELKAVSGHSTHEIQHELIPGLPIKVQTNSEKPETIYGKIYSSKDLEGLTPEQIRKLEEKKRENEKFLKGL